MGRAKVMRKKLPRAKPEDAFESLKSNTTIQRKRRRPCKDEKEKFLAKKEFEEQKAQLTKSGTKNTGVKTNRRKAPKNLELTESEETTSPSFALFQELPTDIRLKIWNLALPGPRLVEMSSHFNRRMNNYRKALSILHVCSESRKEALKSYTAYRLPFQHWRDVYVNFQIDTLYFTDEHSGWMPPRRNLRGYAGPEFEKLVNKVRFVAIRLEEWKETPEESFLQAILQEDFVQRFSKLEKLTVVMHVVTNGAYKDEITDDREVLVWDEWPIGENFINKHENFTIDPENYIEDDDLRVIFKRSYFQRFKSERELLEFMMTRDYCGLKDIQARIVTLKR